MKIIRHQLVLYNPVGNNLAILQDEAFAGLSYALRENEPGVLELTLPGDFDASLLFIDGQIEVYRSYGGGTMNLEGQTAWFIRKWIRNKDEAGIKTIQVTAYSAAILMKRRIVAYAAGSSYAEKTDLWDDLMRETIRENYGALAVDTTRDLSPWLTVESDLSLGASAAISMPRRIILNALQDIINAVKESGTYAAFDVVRVGTSLFEFRVFIGARGNDHSEGSPAPVIVSEDHHNLLNPMLENNWETEHNFIYATGQGQEEERVEETAQDDTRIGISPFNRQEFHQDARQAELATAVQAEANSILEKERPRQIFTGSISQTEGSIYGVHWGWGDIVTAKFEGQSFTCHVEAVQVIISANGTEVVQGHLRSITDVT